MPFYKKQSLNPILLENSAGHLNMRPTELELAPAQSKSLQRKSKSLSMISFFYRKIRQIPPSPKIKSLDIFIYAIGEIILVVRGNLIALGV